MVHGEVLKNNWDIPRIFILESQDKLIIMRKYIFLYFLFGIQTVSAQLDNLYAFTHPKFFFSLQCECNRFDFDNIYLSLYDTNANFVLRTIIPANFDVGHQVIIMGKKGDFFKIKF